jgi:hypothetical protein
MAIMPNKRLTSDHDEKKISLSQRSCPPSPSADASPTADGARRHRATPDIVVAQGGYALFMLSFSAFFVSITSFIA